MTCLKLGMVDPPKKVPKTDMWVCDTEKVRDQMVSQLDGKNHEGFLGLMLSFSIESPGFLVGTHDREPFRPELAGPDLITLMVPQDIAQASTAAMVLSMNKAKKARGSWRISMSFLVCQSWL